MLEFANRFDGVSGSEIRKIFSLLKNPEIISFAGGNPSPEAFPNSELAAISDKLIQKHGASVLQYGATLGYPALIDALRQRHADIMRETDDIIILSGSSQGIELFTRALLNEGDPMLVESPTFLGALQTFYLAGADVQAVPLEDDGVNIEELEELIKIKHPKFFYIIPTFQNPSGKTTSLEKRKAVYELCAKYNVAILEDDPYEELRYEGEAIKSIKSMDEAGIVCRLFSFSKTVSPGIRVGYAIANKDVIEKLNLLKQGADVHTSNLSQGMVAEFLGGAYEAHVSKLKQLYRQQRDAMLAALDECAPAGVSYTRPKGGFFIWMTLPEGVDSRDVFARSVEQNVAFVPGMSFYTDKNHKNTLRLNFSMPSVDKISVGVKRLCEVIGAD